MDRLDSGIVALPATERQKEMVGQLLRDFPLCRGLFEYEDYLASPTHGNATEFITRAIEDNADSLAKRENYVDYIAKRPRAERVGSHGLFTGTDDPLVLSQIAEAVANHPGNVWLPIISLRREDAARLGYDSAARWKDLLAGYAPQIAEAMKIPLSQFRWYAAFHDESHHPHVHMVCYSADGKSGFLDREGIAKIKSGLAKEIFQQDLTEIYRRQTQQRDALTEESHDRLRQLIDQMRTGTLTNPNIERLMLDLAKRLRNTSGKKQYGYLKAPLKAIVDGIVDELEKDPRIAAAYELWYQTREEVLRSYKNDMPERLPLSRQNEFKRIKNMVIEEAVRLGEYTELFIPGENQEPNQASEYADSAPEEESQISDTQGKSGEAPRNVTWKNRRSPSAKYRVAKRILADPSAKPEQINLAVDWLTQAAEAGLDYAQYALGKLYRDGGPVAQDRVQAVIWFSEAAEQGHEHAMYALGKLNLEVGNTSAALRWFHLAAECGNPFAQYALGKLYFFGRDVPQDKDAAVRWLTLSAEQGNEYAQSFLNHMEGQPPILSNATRLLHHMSRIFQDQAPPSLPGINFVDSKLRRRIREKKIAMGHKPDDHEDQGIAMR